MKTVAIGAAIGATLIGYKVTVYATAAYKLRKEKRKKIVNLGKVSEYKTKLDREKEQ